MRDSAVRSNQREVGLFDVIHGMQSEKTLNLLLVQNLTTFICRKYVSAEKMPVTIDGRMCLPFGARVYQLDSKDPRNAAVFMLIPAILAIAGLISCNTAIAGQNVQVAQSSFSIGVSVTIGFRQMVLTASAFFDQSQTFSIKSACPGADNECIKPINPADAAYNTNYDVCIPASSYSSFTASQVFGAVAICFMLILPCLIFFQKVNRVAFAICSWIIVLCLIISVCCAVLGCRQIESCIEQNNVPTTDASTSITKQAYTYGGANCIVAAILFQFFIWL